MRIENNCFIDTSINDTFVLTKRKRYFIQEGTPLSGTLIIAQNALDMLGAIPFDEHNRVWLPRDGKLSPHKLDGRMMDDYYITLRYILYDWLETFGHIDKICINDLSLFTAQLDDHTVLKYLWEPSKATVRIKYSGRTINVMFENEDYRFYEVTPFGKFPGNFGRVTYDEESIVPAAHIKFFGNDEFISAAEAIRFLKKYDGKNWPGTSVPILFKGKNNREIIIDEMGIRYNDGTTVFITPVRARAVEKRANGALYDFGATKLFVKYRPSISEFISYIRAAEVLYKIGDILVEFETI